MSVLGVWPIGVHAVATTESHHSHLLRFRAPAERPSGGTLSVVYGRGKAHPVGSHTVPPASRARNQKLEIAFGKRLRALRLERGLTQEQLAEGAEVHPTFISNLERGYSAPTLYTLLALAKALDVKPGDLVDGLKA